MSSPGSARGCARSACLAAEISPNRASWTALSALCSIGSVGGAGRRPASCPRLGGGAVWALRRGALQKGGGDRKAGQGSAPAAHPWQRKRCPLGSSALAELVEPLGVNDEDNDDDDDDEVLGGVGMANEVCKATAAASPRKLASRASCADAGT